MTATVRIYGYAGLTTAHLVAGGSSRPTSDSLSLLQNPYLGGEVLTAGAVAVTSSVNSAPAKTTLLQVQVQPGKSIYYEVTPENLGVLRVATTDSPIIRGDTLLNFRAGWRLSVLEAVE